MNEAVTVVALLRAKPGKEEALRQALSAMIAPTRREPGCINYDLHQAHGDPATFVFYENWRSQRDLDEHLKMPYIQAVLSRADELLAEPPDLRLFRMLSRSVPSEH